MSAPVFPFERPLRAGVLPREIMCRRCAGWTAWDGQEWRHVDGSAACVQPEQVWFPSTAPLDEIETRWDESDREADAGAALDEIADSEQIGGSDNG